MLRGQCECVARPESVIIVRYKSHDVCVRVREACMWDVRCVVGRSHDINSHPLARQKVQ